MSPELRGTARVLPTALALACAIGNASAEAPLTTADLIRFLKAGVGERTILAELADRGFAEALDEPREAALRAAGAGETLVVAVRRAAPVQPQPVPSPLAPPPADPPSPPAARRATFAADTRTVRVPVSVLDRSGQPVLGLRAEDFRISDEGKRQPVTLFSGERRALRIAVALDVSGSMDNKIRQVERALKHFIDLLEPKDEILVLTFNDRVNVIQDFTSDREQLGRVLDMLTPFGGTALYDAAAEAIRRVAPGAAESKAVVLVSDGLDTSSATSLEALRELARHSEVPIYSIGLDSGERTRDLVHPPGGRGPGIGIPGLPGRGRRRPGGGGGWPGGGGPGGIPLPRGGGRDPRAAKEEGFDAKPLLGLAEETGGRAEIVKGLEHYTPGVDLPGAERIKTAAELIAMTLRHRYLLGYEPPEGRRGWRTIRVDVDRPAAAARARKGYYAGIS
jgi:VWFA-related protein